METYQRGYALKTLEVGGDIIARKYNRYCMYLS